MKTFTGSVGHLLLLTLLRGLFTIPHSSGGAVNEGRHFLLTMVDLGPRRTDEQRWPCQQVMNIFVLCKQREDGEGREGGKESWSFLLLNNRLLSEPSYEMTILISGPENEANPENN